MIAIDDRGGAQAPRPNPSTAEVLLALAARCEAEKPSDELDLRIFLALFNPDVLVIDDAAERFPRPHKYVSARSIWNDDWAHWSNRTQLDGARRELAAPYYTASLDAAVTLVPKGDDVFWQLGHDGEGPDPSLFLARVLVCSQPKPVAGHVARADKAALALCAAALRSQAAMGG